MTIDLKQYRKHWPTVQQDLTGGMPHKKRRRQSLQFLNRFTDSNSGVVSCRMIFPTEYSSEVGTTEDSSTSHKN
jgi:hypothetical protein